MKIKNISKLLFLLVLISSPLLVGFDNEESLVIVKFSYGGMKLTISSDTPISITGFEVTNCDGTKETFYLNRTTDFTYINPKPMKQVNVIIINPKVLSDGIPRLVITVSRICGDGDHLTDLYCNVTGISARIHRSPAEPISFKSTRFVFKAGIRIPTVNGITWARNVFRPEYDGMFQSLSFDFSTKEWSGTFPSMYIPIGKYENAELIVVDEFGNQAKCWIGKLEILP